MTGPQMTQRLQQTQDKLRAEALKKRRDAASRADMIESAAFSKQHDDWLRTGLAGASGFGLPAGSSTNMDPAYAMMLGQGASTGISDVMESFDLGSLFKRTESSSLPGGARTIG